MTAAINHARLEEIARSIEQAQDLYYRLVLVVGPTSVDEIGTGRVISDNLGLQRINVGMQLAERLLELPTRQRSLRVGRILEDAVRETAEDVVLLDNLEILFEASLRQDPLRLIQGLSRTRTVVAMWSGNLEGGNLVYAVPGHPEYCNYPAAELLLVATCSS
jgi:hypothetical protein